jgi:hypothetical protein
MIDENPPIQPKRRSPRGASRPIQIQERDLASLYSLSVGRYLTAPAIEWLHYPGWRERYKAYLERQKTDESLFYRPLNHVYRRLIALRAGEAPLVYRLTRANERARLAYARLADAYLLAEAGAELLCAQHGYELSDLWYEGARSRTSSKAWRLAPATRRCAPPWSSPISNSLTGAAITCSRVAILERLGRATTVCMYRRWGKNAS